MAKILDNLLPVSEKRAIKLQQKYNWLETERDALPGLYEDKKHKALQKFSQGANKKLLRPAFLACDKEQYAQAQLEEQLKTYDVKHRLSYRAIHHQAAVAIFKAAKAQQDWTVIAEQMLVKEDALRAKREAFIAKLEQQKEKFLAAHQVTDEEPYKALKEQYDAQYESLSKGLTEKHEALVSKKQGALQSRMDRLSRKIQAAAARNSGKYELDEDVILSVQGLKMYFGGLKAVDDLTFDVKKSEIFGLIGPNGAGKTTVFNCITQFYKPTDGTLLFRTKDDRIIRLTDYQVHDIVLKGIARTFQNVEVVKEVSVLENLLIAATRQYTSSLVTQMFHLPLLGREERAIRARADRILKYMDLNTYRDRLCWGLPYGVLKRVEIARALMCNPQLIILDEPAAGLNESETRELAAMINKIRDDFGCTVLLVEHDMSLVMNVCDHICAISFGKKLAYGTAQQIQQSKEVQEAYLGTGGA